MDLSQMILRILYKYIFKRLKIGYFFIDKLRGVYGDILDMGGGPAIIYDILGNDELYYVSLDIDYNLLIEAPHSVDKVCSESEAIVFRDKAFDHVIIHEALHHFKNPIKSLLLSLAYIRECVHLIDFDAGKIGGKIFKYLHHLVMMKIVFYSLEEIIRILKSIDEEISLEKTYSRGLNGLYYLKICNK